MKYKYFILFFAAVLVFELVRHFYFKPKFNKGEEVFSFKERLLNGENFTLNQLKGRYVLVDFWGSWCGSCRKENPEIVKLYKNFNSKKFKDASGFDILNIGIETNETSWKKAIEKDELNWKYHILQNQKFDSELVKKFGVKSIPTKYLLDPDNKVVLTNPSVKEVSQFLSGKLDSQ